MKLYIKPWCPWCVSALQWLDQRGFQYEAIDVDTDKAAFALMKDLSGQTKTPTMVLADGRILADFGTDELEAFVKQHNLTP